MVRRQSWQDNLQILLRNLHEKGANITLTKGVYGIRMPSILHIVEESPLYLMSPKIVQTVRQFVNSYT